MQLFNLLPVIRKMCNMRKVNDFISTFNERELTVHFFERLRIAIDFYHDLKVKIKLD